VCLSRPFHFSGVSLSAPNPATVLAGEGQLRQQGLLAITDEELEKKASFLAFAIMPNGKKHEDWLKDKERREENSDPS
jgi:hypothetical protein